MNDAISFLNQTGPAAEALFQILNRFGTDKMRSAATFTKADSLHGLNESIKSFEANDVAREVIAGSILQLAFFAIDNFSTAVEKPTGVLRFEAHLNQVLGNMVSPLTRKEISFPIKFCIGREIGGIPIGVFIYAGRNQFNHYSSERLNHLNEVVFDALHKMCPKPFNGHSFNLRDERPFHSYSIICLLGWITNREGSGFDRYSRDLEVMLEVHP